MPPLDQTSIDVLLISGEPNSGKTWLAKQLAAVEHRIHLDNICMMLAIRRPDLLPRAIADEIPDIDLATISRKIHQFCVHLAATGHLDELVREYVGVLHSRKMVLVAEGYALKFIDTQIAKAHQEVGCFAIQVIVSTDISIEGRAFSQEDGILVLKGHTRRHVQPFKYL